MFKTAAPWLGTVVLVLASLTSPAPSFASQDGRLGFGLKIGLNVARCRGLENLLVLDEWEGNPPGVNEGSRFGFTLGGFLSYRLSDHLHIQQEVLYLPGGCKRDFDFDLHRVEGSWSVRADGTVETGTRLDYFEFPTLLKLVIGDGENSSPFFFVGPSLGVNTKSDFEYTADVTLRFYYNDVQYREESGTGSDTIEISDTIKSFDYSLVFGAGYALSIGRGSLTFEVRYALGLTDILEKTGKVEIEKDLYIYLDEAKRRAITILVGYAFR